MSCVFAFYPFVLLSHLCSIFVFLLFCIQSLLLVHIIKKKKKRRRRKKKKKKMKKKSQKKEDEKKKEERKFEKIERIIFRFSFDSHQIALSLIQIQKRLCFDSN